jgi:DNA-binding MarR family transcriptional regulator
MTDQVDLIVAQWNSACPDRDVDAMHIFSRLFRLSTLAQRDVERSFRALGLSLGEFDVLAALYRSGAPHVLNPQKLVETLLLSSGAMTNRLDRLEAAGLVARQPNAEDRRGVIVTLTAAGLQAVQQALDAYLQVLEHLLVPVSGPQREKLAGLLRRLLCEHDQAMPGGLAP